MNTFTLLTIIGAAALQQVDAFSLPNTPQDRRSMIQQIVTASTTVVALPSFPANALLDNASRDVPAFAG
eukprot:CAMPEP_0113401312 /NCGR_PEP_ID=MMETSP0013_2-20120614/16621_1 /TAXON_ID=2843 ORGANISM="Skeletonema costatum, Strain 1716" /NCGR_SAMPLE_ID=MMETSP0013_2 /ASSEMBLY_ACC=CAM_ASM_000158 /LENGTH=68 /DNA_ID=CAMNT_0000286503 /DNA_START=56 /DNA_END=258 /DNA_ORIENTATION=+ /assembly_acc=CAM_ASM_000158